MTDFYCEVTPITKIEKHPNADTLSVATVLNYPVVIKTDSYHEGQLVSYISVEAIVPDNELFHFLAPPPKKDADGNIVEPSPPVGQVKERSRTIRAKNIRGVYSEGLIVDVPEGFKDGDSVIEHFGITRKEPEEEVADRSGGRENDTNPKTFSLNKYDIEGLAKYGYVFEDSEEVLITEKLEGENMSIMYAEDRLWVKSRNYFKKEVPGSHWWELPRRLGLEEKLREFPNLAIYGEKYGHVPKFVYDCTMVDGKRQREFRIFDIWDIKNKKFLPWDKVVLISEQLGLETVPVLYRGAWKADRSLCELAEENSAIGNNIKEGWVMRSIPEGWHPKLGRKIIKYKSHAYKLLKGKE